MPLIKMTRELSVAASMDAGNRSMWAAGRAAWKEDDAEAARLEQLRLWPDCPHGVEPQNCMFCFEAAQTA